MSYIDPITGLPTPTSLLGPLPPRAGSPVSPLTQALLSAHQSRGGGLASLPGSSGGVLARGLGGTIGPATPAASLAGQAAPITSSMARMPSELGFANQLGRVAGGAGGAGGLLSGFTKGGLGLKGVAGRAGLGATAGSIGSGLIDTLDLGGQNSNLEQGLQGAAWGAGLGGTLLAPTVIGAPLGAAIGGIAGGAIGVLSNIFGGGGDDDKPDPVAVLGNAINAAGLPPDLTEEILSSYDTLMALAEGQPEGEMRDAARAQAFDQAGQMVLMAMQQKEQATSAANNTLALQAQAQQIFEPLASDIETSGMLYADAMQGIRDRLPESYRAISDATVARELSSSQKLANAYRAQAAITPIAQQLTQYQHDQQAYAAQMFQQQLAQLQGGGGGTTADLLAQVAG